MCGKCGESAEEGRVSGVWCGLLEKETMLHGAWMPPLPCQRDRSFGNFSTAHSVIGGDARNTHSVLFHFVVISDFKIESRHWVVGYLQVPGAVWETRLAQLHTRCPRRFWGLWRWAHWAVEISNQGFLPAHGPCCPESGAVFQWLNRLCEWQYLVFSNDLSGVGLGWMKRGFGAGEAIWSNKIILHCLTVDYIFSADIKVKNPE